MTPEQLDALVDGIKGSRYEQTKPIESKFKHK